MLIGERPALALSVQHACWWWPVAGTSSLVSVLPVVSSDSDSDSDLSSSSLEDRLSSPGLRDPKGGGPWGESGECGNPCWFLKLQGQVALLLPWASAPHRCLQGRSGSGRSEKGAWGGTARS